MAQDDFLRRGNIKRFEQKLKDATNEGERKILTELIVNERRHSRSPSSD